MQYTNLSNAGSHEPAADHGHMLYINHLRRHASDKDSRGKRHLKLHCFINQIDSTQENKNNPLDVNENEWATDASSRCDVIG